MQNYLNLWELVSLDAFKVILNDLEAHLVVDILIVNCFMFFMSATLLIVLLPVLARTLFNLNETFPG